MQKGCGEQGWLRVKGAVEKSNNKMSRGRGRTKSFPQRWKLLRSCHVVSGMRARTCIECQEDDCVVHTTALSGYGVRGTGSRQVVKGSKKFVVVHEGLLLRLLESFVPRLCAIALVLPLRRGTVVGGTNGWESFCSFPRRSGRY